MELADSPVLTAAAVPTSLWQVNMVGIKVERFVNWATREWRRQGPDDGRVMTNKDERYDAGRHRRSWPSRRR